MPDVNIELRVGGRIFGGWKDASVTRSIKAFAGTFTLGITDNWSGIGPLTINAGDECRLLINGQTIITGYADSIENSIDAESHTITVSGRDKTADLVDCSAICGQGEVKGQDLLGLAQLLAQPFGVNVKAETDVGSTFTNFSIQPGETVFDALERAAKLRGLLLSTDGLGNLVIQKVGASQADGAVVQGENVKRAALSVDTKDRFSAYYVKAQTSGSDESNGATVAHVKAQSTDENVSRYRPLVIVAEDKATTADAEKRAQWEAAVRAANAEKVTATVQGFEQKSGGALWTINQLVKVSLPILGIEQEMLIGEVQFSMSDGSGSETQLTLQRAEAFIPEPIILKTKGGSGGDGGSEEW